MEDRRFDRRHRALALALGATVALGLGACATSGAPHRTPASAAIPRPGAPRAVASAEDAKVRHLRGDEDDDDPVIDQGVRGDNDADGDDDRADRHLGFYDSDDGTILGFGRPPDAGTARLIAIFVRRYFAAVDRADGGAVCTMMLSSIARTLPEQYGGDAGPRYLRGAKTCAGVMTRLLRHGRLTTGGTRMVAQVRVAGSRGIVVWGSGRQRAAYMPLQRGPGGWRLDAIQSYTLP